MLKKITIGLSAVLILLAIGIAYVLPWALNRPAAPLGQSPEVTLTSGTATGGWTDESQTIAVYNGLPYAAPPICRPAHWTHALEAACRSCKLDKYA